MGRDVCLVSCGGVVLHGRFEPPAGRVAAGAVVLVHGLRSDSREFADFPLRLSRLGLGVLSLDLSGHGRSSGVRTLLSAASHRADVSSAIDWIAGEVAGPVLVLGHSFGAHAALMALEHDAVAAAILVAPQARSGGSLGSARRIVFRALAMVARAVPKLARHIHLPMAVDYRAAFADPAAAVWAAEIGWDCGRLCLGTLAYASEMDNAKAAAKAAKPVLVAISELDAKVPPAASERVARAVAPSLCQVVHLRGAGHSPFAEAQPAAALAEAIGAFAGIIAQRETP